MSVQQPLDTTPLPMADPFGTLSPDAARSDPAAWCSCATSSLPSPAGAIVVLRVAGEVDLSSRHLVETALGALLDSSPSHLLVDLSGMQFCDVTGLTMLVHACATATARGIGYSISAPPRHANRVWTLLWPDDELPLRHATAGAGLLAAMAAQKEHRSRTRPRPSRKDRSGCGSSRIPTASTATSTST